jgi:hypothetical protein
MPFSSITAPSVLTRASDAIESATTDSLHKAECMVPNARQDSVKKPIIPCLNSFDSQNSCKIANASIRFSIIPSPQCCAAGDSRQGAIYLHNKYSSSLALLVSQEASFSGAALNPATPVLYAWIPRNASSRWISPPQLHLTFINAVCCPCCKNLVLQLDQVKVWQQLMGPAIDVLN